MGKLKIAKELGIGVSTVMRVAGAVAYAQQQPSPGTKDKLLLIKRGQLCGMRIGILKRTSGCALT